MPAVGRPRVAVTLTQNWHAVPGGTAVAANALAAALAATGRVDLVGIVPAGAAPAPPWQPPVPTAALPLRVPWLYDAWHLLRRPRVCAAVGRAAAEQAAAGPVDLVHLTVPICCPPEPVPMVATVHDLFPLTMPEMFSRRGVRLMSRGLARIRGEATLVMVPSATGAAEFARHGFDPGRLRVVPLGVDPVPPSSPDRVDAALAVHGLDAPYVLFVGTAEPRKGLDVLVRAMARLARTDVLLVVAGPSGWGDALAGPPPRTPAPGGGEAGDGESGGGDVAGATATALAALGGRVRRLGFVPADDLALLRAGAAVCCLPSRAEGFGLPVLEAMAAGAPVVTTAGTPMEEIAGDAALCVPVGDADALAAALATVLDDRALAARLAAAGRARAEVRTWEATAAAVLDVYAEALDEGPRP
jgi:glycosyltransferase involved in cell wall biosynthesis